MELRENDTYLPTLRAICSGDRSIDFERSIDKTDAGDFILEMVIAR